MARVTRRYDQQQTIGVGEERTWSAAPRGDLGDCLGDCLGVPSSSITPAPLIPASSSRQTQRHPPPKPPFRRRKPPLRQTLPVARWHLAGLKRGVLCCLPLKTTRSGRPEDMKMMVFLTESSRLSRAALSAWMTTSRRCA